MVERGHEMYGVVWLRSTCRECKPLYRIKKRKRRQTHLLPFRHRETSNPLYDSRDTTGKRCGAKSVRCQRKFSGVSLQPSRPAFHFSSLLFHAFRNPFVLFHFYLLHAALWSVCSELFFRCGASSKSFWVSLSFRITCRVSLIGIPLWIFSSKTDLIRPYDISTSRYLALVEKFVLIAVIDVFRKFRNYLVP